METAVFLLNALVISLTGVMAPGSVTAATIAHGARRPGGGALIAVGHGVVEFPLMFLIVLGLDAILKSSATQIAIGIVGGLFLLWMGIGMIRDTDKTDFSVDKSYTSGPVLTGIVLSATNPYFLFWWATVGIILATEAREFGWFAFVLFTIVHWLCDLVWLGFLGWASFKGSKITGGKTQRVVLGVCGAVLIFFSVKFIYAAVVSWVGLVRSGDVVSTLLGV